jgi:hypothetical protein
LESCLIDSLASRNLGTPRKPFQWTNEIKRYKKKYETKGLAAIARGVARKRNSIAERRTPPRHFGYLEPAGPRAGHRALKAL